MLCLSRFALACLLAVMSVTLLPPSAKATPPTREEIARQLVLPPAVIEQAAWVRAFERSGDPVPPDAANGAAIQTIDLARVARDRLLIRVGLNQPIDPAEGTLNLYLDLDHDAATGRTDATHAGVDLAASIRGRVPALLFYHPDHTRANTDIRSAQIDDVLWITIELRGLAEKTQWTLRAYGLSQRAGGRSSNTPRDRVVELGASSARIPALQPEQTFRYEGERVRLETLANKGLQGRNIPHTNPGFEPGRERPQLLWHPTGPTDQAQVGKAAALPEPLRIPVHLLEEAGVTRNASPLRFGFPLPRGAVFDSGQLALFAGESPAASPLPAQITATSLWPDRSVRWALIEAPVPLAADQTKTLQVRLLPEPVAAAPTSTLQWTESEGLLRITTGPLEAVIDTRSFHLLSQIRRRDAQGHFSEASLTHRFPAQGITLFDETGVRFSTAALPPDRVTFERTGPQVLSLRIEGSYGSATGERYQRYITRLTFFAGESRIQVAHTHLNDHLETEFTDIASLSWPVAEAALPTAVLSRSDDTNAFNVLTAEHLSVFQADENTTHLALDGQPQTLTRPQPQGFSGVFQWSLPQGTLSVAMAHFAERWPKGLESDARGVRLHLLPPQPDADYGVELPDHLRYPFVEGFYRSKWGMAFTEHWVIDLATETDSANRAEQLHADLNHPVVAVIPATWHAETQALGTDLVAAPRGEQFGLWDQFAQKSYAAYQARNIRDRAFGYFNHGDWFGERGRNWGNNEYDMAQNYFLQFARTGNRDFFRLALLAARHQADVDMVHAYPDPWYVGANHQHSIGHTGQWSHRMEKAGWSYRYDFHTAAGNGHTWAEGLVMAWQLAGEPRAGEAAIGLGEHITWAMGPQFTQLGTHERSAGWSLRAILALHRLTGDPKYLQIAERLAQVTLEAQDLQDTGVWPHRLPRDHAGGQEDLEGNNLFLMGILLTGLKTYHEETGDPAVERAILAATDWVVRSWDPALRGWPYSALRNASPIGQARTNLNPLIATAVAYAGTLANNPQWLSIAHDALQAVFAFDRAQSMGKDISIRMIFVPEALVLLQRWYATHAPKATDRLLAGGTEHLERLLVDTPAARRFSLRAPDRKVFHLQLGEVNETVQLIRTPRGALPRRLPATTIQIIRPDGSVLHEERHTDDPQAPITLALPGAAGDTLHVVVEDDQRAIWHLQAPRAQVVAEVGPGLRIGGVSSSRYPLYVPPGTERFSVQITGVHTGMYGAALIAPDGTVASHRASSNTGEPVLPTTGFDAGRDERPEQTLAVTVPAGQDGAFWQLVLWAAGDIGVQIQGVPPFLALEEARWFVPATAKQ